MDTNLVMRSAGSTPVLGPFTALGYYLSPDKFFLQCHRCNWDIGILSSEDLMKGILAKADKGGLLCPECRAKACKECGVDLRVHKRGILDKTCLVCDFNIALGEMDRGASEKKTEWHGVGRSVEMIDKARPTKGHWLEDGKFRAECTRCSAFIGYLEAFELFEALIFTADRGGIICLDCRIKSCKVCGCDLLYCKEGAKNGWCYQCEEEEEIESASQDPLDNDWDGPPLSSYSYLFSSDGLPVGDWSE